MPSKQSDVKDSPVVRSDKHDRSSSSVWLIADNNYERLGGVRGEGGEVYSAQDFLTQLM